MKIPFDIKYRPQIESGEYKVETRDGKPARILCWDKVDECGQYIVALVQYTPEHENIISVCEDGIYKGSYGHGYDLFIVTPEEELTEFEKKLSDVVGYAISLSVAEPKKPTSEFVKEYAAELLDLARTELTCQGNIVLSIEEFEKCLIEAQEKGRKEALKDLPRWRIELSEMELAAYGIIGGGVASQENPRVYLNGRSIDLYSLKKLPGFKEED